MFGQLKKKLPILENPGISYNSLHSIESSQNIQLKYEIIRLFGNKADHAIYPGTWHVFISSFDFLFSELDYSYDETLWKNLKLFVKHFGMVLPYKSICYICDYPMHTFLDDLGRFHAVGKPAVEYSNGFKLYFYHGNGIPEKYGCLSPKQWRVEWLFTEKNSNLRRVLMHGIGYERISKELNIVVIHSLKGYKLIRVEHPIYLDYLPLLLVRKIDIDSGQFQLIEARHDSTHVTEALCSRNRWLVQREGNVWSPSVDLQALYKDLGI